MEVSCFLCIVVCKICQNKGDSLEYCFDENKGPMRGTSKQSLKYVRGVSFWTLYNSYYLADYSVCQTIHRINVETGQTIQLSKRCAISSECTMNLIGCHDTHITGIQVSTDLIKPRLIGSFTRLRFLVGNLSYDPFFTSKLGNYFNTQKLGHCRKLHYSPIFVSEKQLLS